MATTNDITGNLLVSKYSEAYRDNYDSIFRKKSRDIDVDRQARHENFKRIAARSREECEGLTVVARENYNKVGLGETN